jgi:hypothetical protein
MTAYRSILQRLVGATYAPPVDGAIRRAYGVSKRVSFKPRPDYRLIAAEMTATR